MALPDLTGQNIENTYQRVIQTDGTNFYDGTGSLVNFGEAVFPYTGSAIISGSLIITGSTEIQYLTASGLNYPTIDGDEKQLITTDGSGNLSFDWADRTNLDVKNTSGATLALGTPVYISGFQGASIFQISPSSASISSSMPAVGVLSQELAPNEQGHATILGALRGYNTSLYSVNDSLYVGEGILTKDRPTGSALIQKIARVGNSQNNGEITIIGAGRSNDVPNLPPGYAWIGNENWVATAVPTSSFNEDPFPYTGSAAISGGLEVTGDVTIYGTASVDVLVTTYESSSIIYSSGSTKFGDSLDDTHIFTGSVSVTGSLDIKGGITITGSNTLSSEYSLAVGNPSSNNLLLLTNAGKLSLGRDPYFYMPNGSISAYGIFYSGTGGSTSQPAFYIGSNQGGAGRGFYGTGQGIGVSINNAASYGFKGSNSSNVNQPSSFGIGMDTPSALLDIKYANTAGGAQGRNLMKISGSADADHAEVFFISSSGNTGIGTWSPNHKLEVVGNVSASTYYGDGSNLTGISSDPFPYTGSAVISGSLTLTGSFNALLPTSSIDTYFVTYNTASYELEARQVATLINPKVEYLDVTASISSGTSITLPNGLSYISSSTYEYLEVFFNGLRLRYDRDFVPTSTTTIQNQIAFPSGSELTFKSLKA